MLNFDRDRYVRIQTGAVDLAADLHDCVRALVENGPVETVFFMGAGGAGILMLPAVSLLQANSSLPAFSVYPAELVVAGHALLNDKSLVIAPSLSGTTAETEVGLRYCRERGATTIALVGHSDTPVVNVADFTFVNFAEDDTSSESFYLQSLLVTLSLMDVRGELPDYAAIVSELRALPDLLVGVKESFETRAPEVAAHIAKYPYHIVSGAGATWAEAFYYAMCILEEMQWIRTRPIHSSDFFHGTLELVESDVSVLLLKGEDAGRALVERVERFASELTDELVVLDTRDCTLPGISDRVRALISPVLLATILERVSAHLEVQRNHPLITRRYYRKVAY